MSWSTEKTFKDLILEVLKDNLEIEISVDSTTDHLDVNLLFDGEEIDSSTVWIGYLDS